MSDTDTNPPQPDEPTTPPAPVEPPSAPPPPAPDPTPPAPKNDDMPEWGKQLSASVTGLTDTVSKLAASLTPAPPPNDLGPTKVPWIARGGRRREDT